MSAQETREPRRLSETEQRTHPGWTRLQWKAADGHMLGTQYRGPGGEIISKHAFAQRVKSGEIPTVDAASGEVKQPAATVNEPPQLGAASPSRREAAGGESESAAPTFDLPSAEASTRRANAGQASPAELSLTAQIGLIMLTSLLALITRTPELTLSEMEAQAIGTPLANLVAKSQLNRRFGRYLADSSDYTLLGYALYAYGYRVLLGISARAQAEAQAQGTQRGFPHVVQTPTPAPAARPAPVATPPAARPGGADSASGAAGASERTGPATGGIGGAVRGAFAAESSRIVGYNPLPHSGAS